LGVLAHTLTHTHRHQPWELVLGSGSPLTPGPCREEGSGMAVPGELPCWGPGRNKPPFSEQGCSKKCHTGHDFLSCSATSFISSRDMATQ